jgi:hypothetical protein
MVFQLNFIKHLSPYLDEHFLTCEAICIEDVNTLLLHHHVVDMAILIEFDSHLQGN